MATSGHSDHASFRRALRRNAVALARPLPWIGHADPWAVLVSEVMLQQTQTSRVIDPWTRFLTAFPTPRACAEAPLSDVLRLWGGLGYHRRAKALHDAAEMMRDEFDGAVPSEVAELRRLPGIGEYSANAVASFAFGRAVAVVDTNVGRVLARAIANRTLSVRDARVAAKELLPRSNAASFNQSLLDLGAQFCTAVPRCATCPVARACRWNREGGPDPAPQSAGVSRAQPKFHGSNREARGRVIAALRERPRSLAQLSSCAEMDADDGAALVAGLVADGLVECRGRLVRLSEARESSSLRASGVLGNLNVVSSIDVARFKEVLGHFVTGVAVVTATTPEGPAGFTCQTFGALSLEPTLVSFSALSASRSWPRARAVGVVGVNILSSDQESMARVFGRSGADKFDRIAWTPGPHGSPFIEGALAHLEGRIELVTSQGDHDIVVVAVQFGASHPGAPLVFYRGRFAGFEGINS